MIWIIVTPVSALGMCCVLLVRKYTLKRNVVRITRPQNSQDVGKVAIAMTPSQVDTLQNTQRADEHST
jgi:hypothetical protein